MARVAGRFKVLLLLLVLIGGSSLQEPSPAQAETYQQVSNYAVQLVYVRPQRAVDQRLFSDQQIRDSVEAGQRWLEEQTGGRRINFIMQDGVPAIDSVVLSRPELELRENEFGPAQQIEFELRSLGYNAPGVIYAAYYEAEGARTAVCGEASSPEAFPGNTVVLYLQSWCRDYEFAGPGEAAGERDLVLIHELFHAFGAVPSCAPNALEDGHVTNSHDLMVGDGQPYEFPVLLDIDNDDYYGTGSTDCYDTRRSPYLIPQSDDVLPYPVTFVDYPLGSCIANPTGTWPASDQSDADMVIANVTDAPVSVYVVLPPGVEPDPDPLGGSGAAGASTSIGGGDSGGGSTGGIGDSSPDRAVSARNLIATIDPWSMVGGSFSPGLTLLVTDAAGSCLSLLLTPNISESAVLWIGAPPSR